jgi:hypothetical protein
MRTQPTGTRNVLLVTLALLVAGGATFAYLGSRRRLPPTLAGTYGNIATLASSAAKQIAGPPVSETPDAGDAGAPPPPRVTQANPLSNAQLGAPLVNGRYVTECGAPDNMKVVVKVTVAKGRAVAVTVKTTPPNPAVASCVEKATRAKLWDISPKTQRATVTY